MKTNFTKTTMMIMILMTTAMTISSNNFLFSWMSMEINMISILPILTKSNKMKDQTMKYFIIQSAASSILMISMLTNSMFETPINMSIILMLSMLLKMGLVPFHLWVPMMMNSLTWETCIIMTTLQKIIPTIILTQLSSLKSLLVPLVLSLIISPILALKQLSMKKIMAFSSIANSPWMILSLMNSKMQFIVFMLIYSTITLMTMNKMKKMNIMFVNQMMTKSKKKKMNLIILGFSMSGMPPTTGFFPKWMILQSTISTSTMLSMMMILSSMMMTFIYFKMMSTLMITISQTKTNKSETLQKDFSTMFNIFGFPLMVLTKSI